MKSETLYVIAVLNTVYTLSFVGYIGWRSYHSSLLEHCEPIDDLLPLIQNLLLLLLFVLQHSFLKHYKQELNLRPTHFRLLYIFTTTLTLHVIYTGWTVCSPFYTLPLSSTTVLTLHLIAWTWILSALLLADIGELLGFKHISNTSQGLQDPLLYKSPGARRLLSHYRHPVAVGPALLLLGCKVMTVDRLLLSLTLLLYTLARCGLDYQDYLYLRYVSYTARRFTVHKVEIRSKSTVVRETHSSFCFSDDTDSDDVTNRESDDVTTSDILTQHSDNDLGYCSSPTYHKPDYYRILSRPYPATSTTVTETSSQSVLKETTQKNRRSKRLTNS